ncbi:TPA: DUF3310 domain-containing protein [Streptococcus pneumoniae]|nr:DUF3310 domain-containing protein [Streptococcus pneumoniae]
MLVYGELLERYFFTKSFSLDDAIYSHTIKYMLRFQKKNGLEDLKKARKNLDWLIEEMEHE